jgi:hypothetical protein
MCDNDYEFEFDELQEHINEIDRNVLHGEPIKVDLLKNLVKLVDSIKFREITDTLYKADDYKMAAWSCHDLIDDFSDGIDYLERAKDQAEKFGEALELLGLVDDSNFYYSLVKGLEKVSKAYNDLESSVGDL